MMFSLKSVLAAAFIALVGQNACHAESYSDRCQKISLAISIEEAEKIIEKDLHSGNNFFEDMIFGDPPQHAGTHCSIEIKNSQVWNAYFVNRFLPTKSDQEYMDDIVKNNDLYYLDLARADFKRGYGYIVWGEEGKIRRHVSFFHKDGYIYTMDFRSLPTAKLIAIPVQRGKVRDFL